MLAAMPRPTCSRVARACSARPTLELGPVDELEHRLAPEPPGHGGGEPAQRHGLLGDDVEARPDRGRARQRALEGLRDVVGVHVVQHAEAEVRQRERLPDGESPPDVGVEVARGRDDGPARAGDVPGMQDDARHAAGDRLAPEQRLDRRLAGAVLAVGVRGSSSVTGTRAAGPCTQIVPQCSSSGRVGRSASTSCRADSGVKQTMSTTTSASSAAIRSPNVPAASSASRSTRPARPRPLRRGVYGSRSPRLSARTWCPARTSRGTR